MEDVLADRLLVGSTSRRTQDLVATTIRDAPLVVQVQVAQRSGSLPRERTT